MQSAKTHFIGNRWLEGKGGSFSSTDPAIGEIIWEGRSATEDQVREAIDAAAEAFPLWSELRLAERSAYLEGFQTALKSSRNAVSEVISRETGKPKWEALTEVDAMIGKVPVAIEAHNDRCRTVTGTMPDAATAVRYKPHGVVAVVGPFNFPGHLPNGQIVPALLAGNTVVFKPSRQAPLVGQVTVELWEAAGLPPGVINLVQGTRETGVSLTRQEGLAGLFFTGSVEVGKAIHREFAGRPETILALEMGGNNPLVGHEVGDPRAAAYLTILSAYLTAGQRCTCARRLIVTGGARGDTFIDHVVAMIPAIKVGPWTDEPEPFMGPMISARAADGMLEAQAWLASQGGIVLVEMRRLDNRPTFLSPGLVDVTAVADRPDRELFGPLLQLIRVPDFDAAVREANNTAFGLAAGLLSDDPAAYETFRRRIRAGVVNWNRPTTGASGKLPFGGVGASGNHRPAAYFAADFCSYPVASMEAERIVLPEKTVPGIEVWK